MNKPFPLLSRFLALWLTLSLALPGPAFALREIQTKNSGVEERELTQALLGRPRTAGMEERPKPRSFDELSGLFLPSTLRKEARLEIPDWDLVAAVKKSRAGGALYDGYIPLPDGQFLYTDAGWPSKSGSLQFSLARPTLGKEAPGVEFQYGPGGEVALQFDSDVTISLAEISYKEVALPDRRLVLRPKGRQMEVEFRSPEETESKKVPIKHHFANLLIGRDPDAGIAMSHESEANISLRLSGAPANISRLHLAVTVSGSYLAIQDVGKARTSVRTMDVQRFKDALTPPQDLAALVLPPDQKEIPLGQRRDTPIPPEGVQIASWKLLPEYFHVNNAWESWILSVDGDSIRIRSEEEVDHDQPGIQMLPGTTLAVGHNPSEADYPAPALRRSVKRPSDVQEIPIQFELQFDLEEGVILRPRQGVSGEGTGLTIPSSNIDLLQKKIKAAPAAGVEQRLTSAKRDALSRMADRALLTLYNQYDPTLTTSMGQVVDPENVRKAVKSAWPGPTEALNENDRLLYEKAIVFHLQRQGVESLVRGVALTNSNSPVGSYLLVNSGFGSSANQWVRRARKFLSSKAESLSEIRAVPFPQPEGVRPELWDALKEMDKLWLRGFHEEALDEAKALRGKFHPFSPEEAYWMVYQEARIRVSQAVRIPNNPALLTLAIKQLEKLPAPEQPLARLVFHEEMAYALGLRGELLGSYAELQRARRHSQEAAKLLSQGIPNVSPALKKSLESQIEKNLSVILGLLKKLDPKSGPNPPAAGAEEGTTYTEGPFLLDRVEKELTGFSEMFRDHEITYRIRVQGVEGEKRVRQDRIKTAFPDAKAAPLKQWFMTQQFPNPKPPKNKTDRKIEVSVTLEAFDPHRLVKNPPRPREGESVLIYLLRLLVMFRGVADHEEAAGWGLALPQLLGNRFMDFSGTSRPEELVNRFYEVADVLESAEILSLLESSAEGRVLKVESFFPDKTRLVSVSFQPELIPKGFLRRFQAADVIASKLALKYQQPADDVFEAVIVEYLLSRESAQDRRKKAVRELKKYPDAAPNYRAARQILLEADKRMKEQTPAAGVEEMKQILEQAVDSPETIAGLQRVVSDQLLRRLETVRGMLETATDSVRGFADRLAPEDPFLYAVVLWIQETRDRNPAYFPLLERIVERRNLSSPNIPAISVPQLFLHSLSGRFDNSWAEQIERFVRFSQELHLLPGEYGIRALALELYLSGNHSKPQSPELEDLQATAPNVVTAIEILKDPERWKGIPEDRRPLLALFLKMGLLNYLMEEAPQRMGRFPKPSPEWAELKGVLSRNIHEISGWAREIEAMETMPTQFWVVLEWMQYYSYYEKKMPVLQRNGKPVSFEEVLMHLYSPEYAGLLNSFPVDDGSGVFQRWEVLKETLSPKNPLAVFRESLRDWQAAPIAAGAEDIENKWVSFMTETQAQFRGLQGETWNAVADFQLKGAFPAAFDLAESPIHKMYGPVQSLVNALFIGLPVIQKFLKKKEYGEALKTSQTAIHGTEVFLRRFGELKDQMDVERLEFELDLKAGVLERFEAAVAQFLDDLREWEKELLQLSAAGAEEFEIRPMSLEELDFKIKALLQQSTVPPSEIPKLKGFIAERGGELAWSLLVREEEAEVHIILMDIHTTKIQPPEILAPSVKELVKFYPQKELHVFVTDRVKETNQLLRDLGFKIGKVHRVPQPAGEAIYYEMVLSSAAGVEQEDLEAGRQVIQSLITGSEQEKALATMKEWILAPVAAAVAPEIGSNLKWFEVSRLISEYLRNFPLQELQRSLDRAHILFSEARAQRLPLSADPRTSALLEEWAAQWKLFQKRDEGLHNAIMGLTLGDEGSLVELLNAALDPVAHSHASERLSAQANLLQLRMDWHPKIGQLVGRIPLLNLELRMGAFTAGAEEQSYRVNKLRQYAVQSHLENVVNVPMIAGELGLLVIQDKTSAAQEDLYYAVHLRRGDMSALRLDASKILRDGMDDLKKRVLIPPWTSEEWNDAIPADENGIIDFPNGERLTLTVTGLTLGRSGDAKPDYIFQVLRTPIAAGAEEIDLSVKLAIQRVFKISYVEDQANALLDVASSNNLSFEQWGQMVLLLSELRDYRSPFVPELFHRIFTDPKYVKVANALVDAVKVSSSYQGLAAFQDILDSFQDDSMLGRMIEEIAEVIRRTDPPGKRPEAVGGMHVFLDEIQRFKRVHRRWYQPQIRKDPLNILLRSQLAGFYRSWADYYAPAKSIGQPFQAMHFFRAALEINAADFIKNGFLPADSLSTVRLTYDTLMSKSGKVFMGRQIETRRDEREFLEYRIVLAQSYGDFLRLVTEGKSPELPDIEQTISRAQQRIAQLEKETLAQLEITAAGAEQSVIAENGRKRGDVLLEEDREVIRQAVARLKISNKKLAELSGLKERQISGFLKGKRDIRLDAFSRLLKVLSPGGRLTTRQDILDVRDRQGWSNSALAEEAGIDSGQLSRFLNGGRSVTPTTYYAILKALHLTVLQSVVGAQEKGTSPAARAVLANVHPILEQWVDKQAGTIDTLALSQPDKTFDLGPYYGKALLRRMAREAGYPKGLVFVVPPAKLASDVMPKTALKFFVEDKEGWRKRAEDNLRKAVDAQMIEFVYDPALADVVVAEKGAIPLRPGQIFIGANQATIARLTLGLLEELRIKGLLEPGSGSVVMLFSSPKDSVLIFA